MSTPAIVFSDTVRVALSDCSVNRGWPVLMVSVRLSSPVAATWVNVPGSKVGSLVPSWTVGALSVASDCARTVTAAEASREVGAWKKGMNTKAAANAIRISGNLRLMAGRRGIQVCLGEEKGRAWSILLAGTPRIGSVRL